MAANLNVFKPFKKDCILSKSNFSFAEVRWVRYSIREETKNFNGMGTLSVFPKNTTQCPQSGLELRPLDLEKKELTRKPLCLHTSVIKVKLTFWHINFSQDMEIHVTRRTIHLH